MSLRLKHGLKSRQKLLLVPLLFVALALMNMGQVHSLPSSFDGWIMSGHSIVVNDQSFTLYLSARTNEAIADYGTGNLIVANNSCDATFAARICLDNIQYDYKAKATLMKVRGISLAPVISITRAASKTDFLATDQTVFTVTIANSGGLARNITYVEVFPPEFSVTDSDGVAFKADRVVWQGKLEEGKSASFKYTVKALAPFDGVLVSSLTYYNGLQLKTIYSSKLALKTTQPVVMSRLLGDDAILTGEPDNVTINLTNMLPETAVMRLEVSFDPGLTVVSRPYAVKNTSLFDYVWNGEMSKSNKTINRSEPFFFALKGATVGTSKIVARAYYRGQSEADMKPLPQKIMTVTVSERGVIIRSNLKDANLESNQGKQLKVWLQNLNPYVGIRDVVVNLSTGMVYLPNLVFDSMAPMEQRTLVDKFLYAPNVSVSTGYVLGANVSYYTALGDNGSKSFRDTANVIPSPSVTVDTLVSNTNLKAGEEGVITVNVRNPRLTAINNVVVSDTVSSNFQVIGKNSAILNVPSLGTVTAYTYRIRVPNVKRAIVLYVNTTLSYSDAYDSESFFEPRQYIVTKPILIKVEPEPIPLTLSRTIDDSANIYADQQFYAKYVITNTASDQPAQNIVLHLPLAHDFDLVGSGQDVSIPNLDPGESIAISSSDKRRAKVSGTAVLGKAVLEYENIYGDPYSLNGTDTTLTIKENPVYGPAILVEKSAPASVNNTDYFVVRLKVRNIGRESADVAVEDAGRKFNVNVKNGTEIVINDSAKYSAVGKVMLPQAVATYASKGSVFRTASNPVSVDVINNPVLGLEKVVPSSVTNVDPYAVVVKLRNKVEKPVVNITVADGDNIWQVARLAPESSANFSYIAVTKSTGRVYLSPAAASYNFDGLLYTVNSEAPVLNVEEKKLVSVVKDVAHVNATLGEAVKVTLSVKNLYNEPLQVILTDGDKSFTVDLGFGEEKKVGYDAKAGPSTGKVASATYTINGQQFTTLSAPPKFSISAQAANQENPEAAGTNETGQVGVTANEEPKGFFDKVVNFLVSILTWKRGG